MSRYQLEQFAAANTYGSISFSPDGRWVAYIADVSGHLDVWRQPVETAADGSPLMPIQLTAFADDAVSRAVWSPDGQRILASADHDGDERYQLYEILPEQGWPSPLTNAPSARHEIGSVYYVHHYAPFSPDGRAIAYASNERTTTGFDIIVRDLASGATRTIYTAEGQNFAISWSPDGRSVLVFCHHQNIDHDLWLCDVASGEQRHLTPHTGDAKFLPGPWRPDGRGFYLLTDQGREFSGLAFFDLQDNSISWIETSAAEIDEVAVSQDGRYLAWLVNEEGYSHLYVRDGTAGQLRDYDLPKGVYQGICFSPVGPLIGLVITRAVQPSNVYMLNVQTGAFWRLTHNILNGIPTDALVEPVPIRYPSRDERMIPAFLYKPKDLAPGERVPVVLAIHGGPEWQERPDYAFNGFYQYLLNRGIGVLAPNIRGSTGYGTPYQKLIYRDWGGAELHDLEHAAHYLHSLEWVDADHLAVMGASFGGFATLSCATRLPNYWCAAVDICGPANLITFAQTAQPFWRSRMKGWVGDPQDDAEMLRERSPFQHIEQIRAPLLVIQGAFDTRVAQSESDQIVERLRALGRAVEYLVFANEGHGFTTPASWLAVLAASARWLEQYLTADQP